MKEETGDGLYSRQNAQEGEISHRQLSGRISRCELKSGVARGSGRGAGPFVFKPRRYWSEGFLEGFDEEGRDLKSGGRIR